MKRLTLALVILLFIAHQDFWWWDSIEPLAFGFMPVGLAYHAMISICAACVWMLAVRHLWPADVDVGEDAASQRRRGAEL